MDRDDLPRQGRILVRNEWSGINYKDALAVTGKGKIIRSSLPFVPGIDMAGTVVESGSEHFQEGDRVLATGWGIGEEHWGGYSEYQWLDEAWLLPIPDSLSTRNAMIVGTAGFTAMLSVLELEQQGLPPGSGDFLVTGATGGVGSFAVMLLSQLGFDVTAATGKPQAHEYLRSLGATNFISRDVLSEGALRPLDRGRWAGCVDSVGSTTLEAVLSCTKRHGVVAACGLAGGHELNTTVFPFILRGVRLIGIDSNTCPMADRKIAWSRLADLSQTRDLGEIAHEVKLEDIPSACDTLMSGGIMGRYVVRLKSA